MKMYGLLCLTTFAFVFLSFDSNADEGSDSEMSTEIVENHNNLSKEEFKKYIKTNIDRISVDLIMDFVDYGVTNQNMSLIYIAMLSTSFKEIDSVSAYVNFRTGVFCFYGDHHQNASTFFDRALGFYKKLNNLIGQGNVWLFEGDISSRKGNNSEANAYYDRALELYEDIKDSYGQGNVWLSKGDMNFREGNYSVANEYFNKALLFFKDANHPLGLGNVWYGKGELKINEGNHVEADKCYDNALDFYIKINAVIGQGNAWRGKGEIKFRKGNNSKANEYFDKSIEFFEKVNEPQSLGNVWRSKGDVSFSEGNFSKANEYFDKSIEFFEKFNEPRSLGNVFQSKGEIKLREGNHKAANKYFDKALVFYEKANDQIGQGNVWECKGEISAHEGNLIETNENYNKALLFFENVNEPVGQGNVWLSKGDISCLEGKYNEANEYYNKSLEFYERANSLIGLINVWDSKALVFEKENSIDLAFEAWKRSLSFIEELRSKTGNVESKESFFSQFSGRYLNAIDFMINYSYRSEAFQVFEQLKSRVFLDMLAEKEQGIERGVDPELISKRDSLLQRITALKRMKAESLTNEYDNAITKAGIELDDVINKIRRSNPKAAEIIYPKPVELTELQKTLIEDEVVLEYFISDSSVYCLVIGKDLFETVELKFPNGQKVEYNSFYYDHLSNYFTELEDANTYAVNNEIYSILIEPLSEFIAGKDLIIIPDSYLYFIPFEALSYEDKDGNPKYLIEDHSIKYYQSATVLAQQRDNERSKNTNFVAFGDPVFDYDNFIAGKPEIGESRRCVSDFAILASRDVDLRSEINNRLLGTNEELEQIDKIFKTQNYESDYLLRDKATETQVKNYNYQDAGYIHFATHGAANKTYQGLIFSQLPDEDEDGYLATEEIYSLKFNAKLVALSACETALGELNRGEGMIGLTRAMMYAGAEGVLSSLWKVSDQATALFMTRFYSYMIKEGLSTEEALRQTKIDFIRNRYYYTCDNNSIYVNKPYFWSAFVLYGE